MCLLPWSGVCAEVLLVLPGKGRTLGRIGKRSLLSSVLVMVNSIAPPARYIITDRQRQRESDFYFCLTHATMITCGLEL